MTIKIHVGDALEVLRTLPAESVHCVVTSPPYWGLRDYGIAGQLGLEPTPEEHVAKMVEVFREVRRVLRADGTAWINYGDSYAGAGYSNHDNTGGCQREDGGKQKHSHLSGLKPKDLVGMPWRIAFALQADGWYLRSEIIWAKPNPMPESVTDRPTKAHEQVFLLAKSARYFYDADAVREPHKAESLDRYEYGLNVKENPNAIKGSLQDRLQAGIGSCDRMAEFMNPAGRNLRSVWTIATHPFPQAHFATFPPALVEPCVKAGCPAGGTVLDPFFGAGTVGLVADRLGRHAIGIELNPEYARMAENRIRNDAPLFADVARETAP